MAQDKNPNQTPKDSIQNPISRRGFVKAGLVATGGLYLGALDSFFDAVPSTSASSESALLGFKGLPVSADDAVVVPQGYSARVLIAWGDPVSDGPAFKQDASNSSREQELQWGMHNDGLAYFPIRGSERGLLVQNNEYMDDALLFPDGTANWTAEKTRKALAAHGVGIIEIERSRQGEWKVVRPSKYARRITGFTPMKVGGPVAGERRLRTKADPTGRLVLGTLYNCSMGVTPWNTYLTCEENFDDYFRTAVEPPAGSIEARYRLDTKGDGYLVHLTDRRFRVADEPNEPNRFGWIVEIDPFNPRSVPIKRTALGRIKHEGAKVQETRDGRIVVYSGDDETFEYIYRYVSRLPWREARKRGVSPLDDGILYAAKFHASGAGEWLPLTPTNPALMNWSLNDILINTRGAADAVGATKMDRPEWIDTFPASLSAIVSLTNNTRRGVAKNPGPDAANPRSKNVYGHLIRWTYEHDWTDSHFRWEIFAAGGDPQSNKSATVIGDKYGSPDALHVTRSGRLWIGTDMSRATINRGDYQGFGNNQLLCADPNTRETRRFLVGPNGCEVSAMYATPDERTLFVSIQHPGEPRVGLSDPADPKRNSSWPDGPNGGRPRSACVVVTKDDGGVIGT
ncbi:MAG TPA: PhoX family phosphatase [Pyrinomonadaceae bacterium]|nr:PhoX family phosphatase [Pyrinomonadaceae bacterium]